MSHNPPQLPQAEEKNSKYPFSRRGKILLEKESRSNAVLGIAQVILKGTMSLNRRKRNPTHGNMIPAGCCLRKHPHFKPLSYEMLMQHSVSGVVDTVPAAVWAECQEDASCCCFPVLPPLLRRPEVFCSSEERQIPSWLFQITD